MSKRETESERDRERDRNRQSCSTVVYFNHTVTCVKVPVSIVLCVLKVFLDVFSLCFLLFPGPFTDLYSYIIYNLYT